MILLSIMNIVTVVMNDMHYQIWLCLVKLIIIHNLISRPAHRPGFDHLQYEIKNWMVGRPENEAKPYTHMLDTLAKS